MKVRGTAQQVLDKYLALARDASSAGDRILAESCYQYAEHYYRVLNADEQRGDARSGNGRGRQAGRSSEDTPAGADAMPEEVVSEEPVATNAADEDTAEVVVARPAGKAGGESERVEAEAEAPDAA